MERKAKQKRNFLTFCTVVSLSAVLIALVVVSEARSQPNAAAQNTQKTIELPAPKLDGPVSLEKALATRRSIRQFTGKEFTMEQIGQLAWSGQGITEKTKGLRTAPSARASYPMTLYLITQSGSYIYLPQKHALQVQEETDLRQKIAGRQNSIAKSGCTFVIAAKVGNSTVKYGDRAEKWKVLEAGHIAENILLEATSMDLGGVPIGAYDPNTVGQICKLPADMEPVYLVATGYPAEQKTSESGPKPVNANSAGLTTGKEK
jgi:SagB-type dehydrogenase family enzyme